MKKLSILLTFILVFAANLMCKAQNASKTQQLGIFVESNNVFNSSNSSLGVGAMYKLQQKENQHYRFQLFYKQVQRNGGIRDISKSNDSILIIENQQIANSISFGAGKEFQKVFYKNISLYASLDARLGYEKGYSNDLRKYAVLSNNSYFAYNNEKVKTNTQNKAFSLDVLPSIGAVVNKKRLSFGIEVGASIKQSAYTQITPIKYSIYDFDITGGYKRIYVLVHL